MDENNDNLYVQRTLQQKKAHDKRKKPVGLIILIILAVIAIIALGTLLIMSRSPLDSIFMAYSQNYPESIMSIQKVTGENAKTTGEQIKTYCPDFGLSEFYMAQFDNAAKQESIIYILNPGNGGVECMIDRNAAGKASQQALGQNVLATINGDPIYADEVTAAYNNIPAESRTNNSAQEALNLVIDNKLLLQDAAKRGIAVSDEEANNAVNTYLTNNGLALEQLQENLASSGSSINTFIANVKNSLLLQKEVAEVTKDSAAPAEQDIQAYYEENKQGLMTIGKATTHQILVYANDTNVNEKLEYVKTIAAMLNQTNFCELVIKYSEDNMTISRCGLYDFQQGQLLPEFEELVFQSEPGSTKIIRTRLGLHIISVDNVTQPRQLSYDEAKASINDYFVLRNKQAMLNQQVQKLRQEAEIVSYVTQ
jgi:parvulin-like peptidyl-prolyl isomerase